MRFVRGFGFRIFVQEPVNKVSRFLEHVRVHSRGSSIEGLREGPKGPNRNQPRGNTLARSLKSLLHTSPTPKDI